MRTNTADMAAKRSGPPPPPVSPVLREALAKNLRASRLAAGLTQKTLGDLAQVSREYIGDIENGTANVSIDILTILAEHVHVSPFDLFEPAT